MNTKILYSFALIFLLSSSLSAQNYWVKSTFDENKNDITLKSLNEKNYQIYNLDDNLIRRELQNTPLRTQINGKSNTIISFPNEKGVIESFRVVEAPVLSDDLSSIYPEIKTYLGFSLDGKGTRIRFSITPLGLKAMVSKPGHEIVYIQPVNKVSNGQYLVYNRKAKINNPEAFECLTDNPDSDFKIDDSSFSRDANDQLLRTYRIAISTTSQYTGFWDDGNAGNGNAQADALAQVVSSLNRMNEVFEVDMAITFTLINGIELIYSGTDPYGANLNGDLQTNLTNVVGESGYDIGHLFHFAGNNGNAGCIGCVCENGSKGSGFSSHSFVDNDGGPYMADFFDIDYVPHEVGHQMGSFHTHSEADNNAVNFEPGSGTTIMGYAGITGNGDVQDHNDPYFHYGSINQILNNVATAPNNCAVTTTIANNPPIANAGNNYTIPSGTAFILRGSATDADTNDVLTYCWEQRDDGITNFNNFGPTLSSGPVWRSRPPSTSPNRYMPILSRVLVGQLTETNPVETINNSSWETVSTVTRSLNFALTVRDRSETNGVGQMTQSDFDSMIVTVDGNSGPFTVTSQNTNVTWDARSTQTVTWDKAGTDTGSVNTPTVNILLSTDGGQTFPFTIASNVPNDGSHDVTVPTTGRDTTMARVIVEGNNNIFYAVNSTNFTIQESEFVLNVNNSNLDVCRPNDAIYNITYNTFLGFSNTTTFSASGLPAGASISFAPPTASMDGTAIVATVTTSGVALGTHTITLIGTSGAIVKSTDVTLNLFDGNLNAATLISPSNAAIDVADSGPLTWNADSNVNYLVEVATDNGFTAIVESATVPTNNYTTTMLNANTLYYWRVTASNDCITAPTSSVFSFTTANVSCSSFTAGDLPQTISASGAGNSYSSVINIPQNYPIIDVNVTFNATHTWDTDIDLTLTSPNGTSIELTSDNGGNGNDYTNTVFDQEAVNPITGGAAPFTGSFTPEGDLSALYGENSGGNWTLTLVDDADFDGGTFDGFELYLCVQGSLSVNDNLFNESNFVIYPNPNNGEFTIKMSSVLSNKVNVLVYDIRGREIFNSSYNTTNDFSETINLNNAQSGIYLVKIIDGINNSVTRKIIID